MEEASSDRERLILERIMALKQMLEHGGGPVELHELGVLYFHLDNFRQACTYLGDLETRYPDYIETGSAAALHALCLVKAGDLEEAALLLQARVKLNNTDTRLYNMLAFALEKLGRLDQAIETHRTVLRLDPDNAGSLNGLGYLLAVR
ncbi:MAG: tetratricopeptide repeat protein, partial [Spirochaetia bacterium]|nr:tetratricopeptide repeat protein [Spirochaetia bacterium]